MAKRKQEETEVLTTVAEPEQRGYATGSWCGEPQYACRQCAFDTLDLDNMLEHLVQAHSGVAMLQELPPIKGELTHSTDGELADGIYQVDLKEVGK